MESRHDRDLRQGTELKFSDHCDLDKVTVSIRPIIEGDKRESLHYTIKRAELEKMMWWHSCVEKVIEMGRDAL